jgi:hypothetical protein
LVTGRLVNGRLVTGRLVTGRFVGGPLNQVFIALRDDFDGSTFLTKMSFLAMALKNFKTLSPTALKDFPKINFCFVLNLVF